MGIPKTVVSQATLGDIAQRLIEASGDLVKAAQHMHQEGVEEAVLPWTNAHWKAADKIIEAGVLVFAAAKTEVAASKAGRKSLAVQERDRGKRNYAARKARIESAGVTPKKRGRPSKKGT